MGRTTRLGCSVARFAVTALLAALLALLGGTGTAGPLPWTAGGACTAGQETPAGPTGPAAPLPAVPGAPSAPAEPAVPDPPVPVEQDGCPEPAERRRDHGTGPLDPTVHRVGHNRPVTTGQLPPVPVRSAAAGAGGRPAAFPSSPVGRAVAEGGAGRGVVLRC